MAEIREGVPEAGAAAGLVGETLQMCFRERVRAKSFEGTGPFGLRMKALEGGVWKVAVIYWRGSSWGLT